LLVVENAEGFYSAEIEPGNVEKVRTHFPFLYDIKLI